MEKYLGIEIGGTKLQAALGDGEGTLTHLERVPAKSSGGREAICHQIIEIIDATLASAGLTRADIKRIGIGFGGPVDPSAGIVCTSHQVDGWDNFPIVSWLRESVGIPVVLGNDSDMAGLAEANFGAGRGKNRVAYMNIGSGIGGAIVIDGRVYMSQGAGASEIGHLRIRPSHPGAPWQTLEDVASGWNMATAAKRASEHDPEGHLAKLVDGQTSRITTHTLIKALQVRDPAAVDIWLRAIEHLGVAIANVITLLRPEIFAVGGGVSLAGDILFEPLKREVAKQVFAPFADSYVIVPAALGEDVVIHGALKLARDGGA